MEIESGEFRLLNNEFGSHYLLVLRYDSSNNTFLVKDFWEVDEEFSGTTSDDLFVRAHCKRVSAEFLADSIFVSNEGINGNDDREIEQFLAIEEGLAKRKNRTQELPSLVEIAMSKQEFELALELLTEWAMLDKYRSEIYLKREECFKRLNRNAEADYERHVYNTIIGK